MCVRKPLISTKAIHASMNRYLNSKAPSSILISLGGARRKLRERVRRTRNATDARRTEKESLLMFRIRKKISLESLNGHQAHAQDFEKGGLHVPGMPGDPT